VVRNEPQPRRKVAVVRNEPQPRRKAVRKAEQRSDVDKSIVV